MRAGLRIDRYELLEPLGAGGQGSVFKARDGMSGALRALKLVEMRFARDSDLERVRREARALARLGHPALCRCYGLFEDVEHGVLGFAMDHVQGVVLERAIEDPRLTRHLRLVVLLQIARALAYLHEHGLVHRDVKPANIVLAASFWERPEAADAVKLVDLGIAALQDGAARLTETGQLVGSPPHMAPEQIEPCHWQAANPTAATDVFCWGLLAYRLLVGGHAFGLHDAATVGECGMAFRQAAAGDGPAGLPRGRLETVLRRCLQPYPADRYSSAGELVAALEEEERAARPPSQTVDHAAAVVPAPPSVTEVALQPYPHDRASWDTGPADSTLPGTMSREVVLALVVAAALLTTGLVTQCGDESESDDHPPPLVTSTPAPRPTPPRTPVRPAPDGTWKRDPFARLLTPYKARLSDLDHTSNGRPVDTAAQVLAQDRLNKGNQGRDPEDDPGGIAWEQRDQFIALFPRDLDLRAEGQRILRGHPVVRVVRHGSSATVTVLGGGCDDYKANLRWLKELGPPRCRGWEERQPAWRGNVTQADCEARLQRLVRDCY